MGGVLAGAVHSAACFAGRHSARLEEIGSGCGQRGESQSEVGQVAISRGGRGRRTKGGSILGAKASYENPSKFPAATV